MQFEQRFAEAIASGEVTLTFRRWKRQQVLPGNTYRTAAGRLVVDEVAVVRAETITDLEAQRAGYESSAALVADLRGDASLPVYRVRFHLAQGADPRDELAESAHLTAEETTALAAKLARLDGASTRGPWTAATLKLVAEQPAVRAGDLAPQLGMELLDFKLNVRKLKNLGLTISLGTGYRLSPRGETFWTFVNNLPPDTTG